MNEKAANDEANADASGTAPSRELGVDGDDGENIRNIHSCEFRTPIQDDADTHALVDGTSNSPASPLPLLPREMEIAEKDDPLMPTSQIAAAFEEMEDGSIKKSHGTAAAPSGSASLVTTPPRAVPPPARRRLELNEDDEGSAPSTQLALAHAGIAAKSVVEHGEGNRARVEMMDENAPVPVLQTPAAYKEMEHAMRSLPAPLPMMPPMPAAQTAAAYEEMEHAMKKLPAPLLTMPPIPAALTAAIFEEGEGQKVNKTPQIIKEDDSPPPAESLPAAATQGGAGEIPLGRTQPLVVRPMRPPPRSMLPSPENDYDVTNAPSVRRFHEVEATLYRSVVYLGTPVESDLRPWWKKKRIPIAIAVSGLVAGLAVALGATLGSSREPVIASSQPSETQSSLPSHEPSQSSPPSEIPSLRPTFHPSQSAAPSSVPSAPPSTSLVPSTSPSSSASAPPSASALPTAFCFEGVINIFTDSHPEDTSWTLSRITTDEGVPTSKVVREGSPEDDSSPHADEVCLERGQYEFTIYDSFGDGICCDNGAGHFDLVLDGSVVLEGGEFGFSQTVSFSLPTASLPPSRSSTPSRSLSPTFRPSTSFGPSSQVPSLGPTLSLRPSSLPSLLPTAPPSTYLSALIWEQQGQTINGAAAGDESGRSVVLSGDGTIMAVGSPGAKDNNDRPGYVKVYHREDDASSWKDFGQEFEGTANGNRFGEGLALSEDGRTLAIGAPGHFANSDSPGYVRVYQMEGDVPGSSWKQVGQDIITEAGGDQFGESIALSADGRTLAIGNHAHHDFAGIVRIYGWDEDESSWKQLGQDIEGEGPSDNSGFSVDLSSDGMTVAIGSPGSDGNGENSGQVRVYHRKGDEPSWEQLGRDINGEAPGDKSGVSVSFSADGRTLAIGAYSNDGNGVDSGHARVYRIDDSGPSWEQIGQDIDGEVTGDKSGKLSLSADGKTVAIGANGNDEIGPSAGHVKVYRMEDGLNWKQVGRDIDGENPGDNAGLAVSLSTDGKTVAIGSPWNSGNYVDKTGHVRVFNVNY